MNILWSPTALADLQEIYKYIASDSTQAAMKTVLRIQNSVERLSCFPLSGRIGRVAGTRELVVSGTPYICAYDIQKEQIRIAAIIHGRRMWPRSF